MNQYSVEVFDDKNKMVCKNVYINVQEMREACKVFWSAGWKFKISMIVPAEFSWVEDWEGEKSNV
jgi:hypothetical protein